MSSSLKQINGSDRKVIGPVRDRRVCYPVYKETLSELSSELRSDALPVTTIDFPET